MIWSQQKYWFLLDRLHEVGFHFIHLGKVPKYMEESPNYLYTGLQRWLVPQFPDRKKDVSIWQE